MRSTVAFLALMCLSGCSASYRARQAPPPGKLNEYSSIVVYQVRTKDWLDKNPDIRDAPSYAKHRAQIEAAKTEIPRHAIAKLRGHFTVLTAPQDDTLLVKSELIHYDPKTTAGTRVIRVKVDLVDARTGAGIASYDAQGKTLVISMRVALQQCGESLARFILDQAGRLYLHKVPGQ